MNRPEDIIARLDEEMEATLTEQELRLIRAAHETGFLDFRMSLKDLRAMFKAHIAGLDAPKRSKLKRMKMSKEAAAAQKRKDETRIKILLGAYLQARLEHFPEHRDELLRGLEDFIRADERDHAVRKNLDLMKNYL